MLNACAFTGKDLQEQEEAFKVACLTFDELRMSDYLHPSAVSYGTFLKAIKKLMPGSEVRDKLVQGVSTFLVSKFTCIAHLICLCS